MSQLTRNPHLNPGAGIYLFHDARKGHKGKDGGPLQRFGPGGLVLPVGPLDQVSIAENIIVNTEVLPRRGAVVFGGGRGARVVSINTLLPDDLLTNYIIPGSTLLPPYEYDEVLARIGQENHVCRLMIANKSDVGKYAVMADMSVMMQAYTTTRMEGADISVSMEFIEWQEIMVRKVKAAGKTAGGWSDRRGSGRRAGEKPRPRFISMTKYSRGKGKNKKYDLAKVAQAYYGNSQAWRWIANHPKNIAAFGVTTTVKKGNKKVKTRVSIKSARHSNLKAKTKVYLPDTTEKSKGGKTFWQFVDQYKKKK